MLGAGAGSAGLVTVVEVGPEAARVALVDAVAPRVVTVVGTAVPGVRVVVLEAAGGAGFAGTAAAMLVVVAAGSAAVELVVLLGGPAATNSPPRRKDGGPFWVSW